MSVRSCRVVMSCGMAMVVSRNVYAESRWELVTLSTGRSRRTGKRTDGPDASPMPWRRRPIRPRSTGCGNAAWRSTGSTHPGVLPVQLQQAAGPSAEGRGAGPSFAVPFAGFSYPSRAWSQSNVHASPHHAPGPTERESGRMKREQGQEPCGTGPNGSGLPLLVAVSPSVRFQFR